jgi:hypothetical protein
VQRPLRHRLLGHPVTRFRPEQDPATDAVLHAGMRAGTAVL